MSGLFGQVAIYSPEWSFFSRPEFQFNIDMSGLVGLDTFGVDRWASEMISDLLHESKLITFWIFVLFNSRCKSIIWAYRFNYWICTLKWVENGNTNIFDSQTDILQSWCTPEFWLLIWVDLLQRRPLNQHSSAEPLMVSDSVRVFYDYFKDYTITNALC